MGGNGAAEFVPAAHQVYDMRGVRERQVFDQLMPPARGEAQGRNEVDDAIGRGHFVKECANYFWIVARLGLHVRF